MALARVRSGFIAIWLVVLGMVFVQNIIVGALVADWCSATWW